MNYFDPLNAVFPEPDPRPVWDRVEPDYDRTEAELASYVEIANGLDPATQALTRTTHDEFVTVRRAYQDARASYETAMATKSGALSELDQARTALFAGTMDAKRALKNREAVVIAEAKARASFAPIAGLRAAAADARETLAEHMRRSAERGSIQEMLAIVPLFFESGLNSARTAAELAGRNSTASDRAWWPIADHFARAEFNRVLAAEKSNLNTLEAKNMRKNHNRLAPELPTISDFQTALARRSEAFTAQVLEIKERMVALSGQLQGLGGAR